MDEAVANAGARYSPELNVELPVARLFDGLGRTIEFFNRIKAIRGKIKKSCSNAIGSDKERLAKSASEGLQDKINQLLAILNNLDAVGVAPINFSSIAKLSSELRDQAYEYIEVLRSLEEEKKAQAKQQGKNTEIYSGTYGYQQHHLYELTRELTSLETLAKSREAALVNVSALLLLGDAGTGKTHLFCDVAKNRVRAGLATVLLLGEQFNNEELGHKLLVFLGCLARKRNFLVRLKQHRQSSLKLSSS